MLKSQIACVATFVLWMSAHAGAQSTASTGAGTVVQGGGGRGYWRTYDVEDGLASGSVFSITQDRAGNLWFGTWAGASRFDGQTWTTFTTKDGLPNNGVRAICEDREGNLWFGTRGGGVSRYDGRNWRTFTTKDGLAHNVVQAIIQDQDGNFWFGTRGGGVSRFDGKTWTTFSTKNGLVNDVVYCMLQDRDGNLWFGTHHGGVSRYDGREFTSFTSKNGLAYDDIWGGMFQDRDGNLWFGTRGGGASRFDGKTWTTFTTQDGLVSNSVMGITQDQKGNMWFATYSGVSRFDGKTWTSFSSQDGLASNLLWSTFTDRDGYLWFGTQSGVNRYDERAFTTFTTRDGLASNLTLEAFQDWQGHLWFGTPMGVNRFDGDSWTTFTTKDGLASNNVWAIYQDREGSFWFGTQGGGVSRYNGQTWTTFTTKDGLGSNLIGRSSIYQDREGNLWVGTQGGGVSRYNGQTWTTFTTKDGLAGDEVWAILQDREDHLWFSTSTGLSRYDPSAEAAPFTNYRREDGLGDDWILSALQDQDGILWFGTLAGVSWYDPSAGSRGERPRFTTLTTEDGLTSNSVWAILKDREGNLWFGTDSGVSRYDGQVFQTLTAQDGLANSDVWNILQDREGDLWFGTGNGITRFRQPAPSPPPVFVQDVVADRRYEGIAELTLPAPLRLVSFEFGSQSFNTRPEAMVYRYRLKGYEDPWHNTHRRRVEYADLPRGDYTFEIQAVDRDLVYSEIPATVHLEVHLPYERIGLISALVIALGLVAWQSGRVVRRDRALQQSNTALSSANKDLFSVNRELEQKSEDLEKARGAAEAANHAKSLFLANMSHEIRTPMNAILGYAQILQRSPDLGGQHRRAVETIHKSGDHLLNLINDVLDISKIEAGRMVLNPDDFDLREMLGNLGTMFELQCREKGLGWRLAGIGSERLAVHGDEAKLRQVLINLLGNAVKFTKEGEVALRLTRLPEHRYGFEVRDTGPGMTAEEQEKIFQPFQQGEAGMRQGGTGLGLTISQRQLGLMGSALKVDSEVGKGSRFSFAVELPPAQGALRAEGQKTLGQVQRLAAGFSVKALLADDVAENREILSGMLRELGAEVEAVENGQQALERLEGFAPDIVFLDIRMPVLDGLAAVKLIQGNEAWKQVKVVAISASVLEHERQAFLEAGFDDFIDKPFRFERICECLGQQLGVEFEYGESGAEEAALSEAADWSAVRLPEALTTRLKQAAEFYNVTQIEGYLKEMEDLGEGPKKLASHLRGLRQQHDMEGIVEVLAVVSRG